MTTTTCLHCKATTTNGLWLCDLCRRFASECLFNLPIYFRNLARQRRPGRPNGSIGKGGTGGGGTVSVVAVAGRAENDIATWVKTLHEERDIEIPEADTEVELFDKLCGTLASLLTTIGTTEWAGEFVRGIARHERTLRAVTETLIPGWYAGACRQHAGKDMDGNPTTCDEPTFVIPGLTWVTCRRCGATTYARDHLDIVLEEARDWVARPMRIAEAIVALVDTEQSVTRLHKRISKWGERKQIEAIRSVRAEYTYDLDTEEMVLRDVEHGPKRYRLGDVLDLLLAEGQTRTSGKTAKAS